jgi:hypothetical protein
VTGPLIAIGRTGPRCGFVIAAMPPEGQGHLAPSAQTRSGQTLVVGSIYRTSPDGQPEEWRAWLWPVAGGDMHVTRSCEAVDAAAPEKLLERLRKRAGKDGPWWGGGSS